MDPNLASRLRGEVETSNDSSLLSQVGTTLVQFDQDQEGLSLIQEALDLDPKNPSWKESLDSAKAEPVRRHNLHQLMRVEQSR